MPGLRRGALGAMVATARASAQPTTASNQRPKPCPGSGNRVVTMTDCTAAWIVISCPAPTRLAKDMASATTTMICHTPVPNTCTKTSPTSTPRATPIATSTPRRSRFPYVTFKTRIAATGAKKGLGWWRISPASHHASPAVTAHWAIRKPRLRQRVNRRRADW